MRDLVVLTLYRSPRLCRARVELLRALSPEVEVVAVYTGPGSAARRFQRVFQVCHHHYILPTLNTRDNWGNLDQALVRWWLAQGSALQPRRLLFLDWDALLLEPAERLLSQITPGTCRFAHVFPVLDLRQDHWAREFLAANDLPAADPLEAAEPLHRAIIFAWGCTADVLAAAADHVMQLKGYCEMRLPYALRQAGAELRNFQPHPLTHASASGRGLSRQSLHELQSDPQQIQLAHPVYLPIMATDLRIDRWAWLLEMPFLKTFSRQIKSRLRRLGINLGLIPPLNP